MARSTRTAARVPAATEDAADAVKDYRHKEQATAPPDAGAALRFRAKREIAIYWYDSSLSPALDWVTDPAWDNASWLIAAIEDAVALPNQTFPAIRELRGADGPVLMSGGLAGRARGAEADAGTVSELDR